LNPAAMYKTFFVSLFLNFSLKPCIQEQPPAALLQKLKAKLDLVKDYQAEGTMKTNVSFLKVPQAEVKIYYKKPDRLKIKNEKGISLVPKGSFAITLNNLFSGSFSALDAGSELLGGKKLRVLKLLPADNDAEIVLSTLYVDENRLLILKATTTTRENGTYEVEMEYGKYLSYSLPDKIICTFNIKDYKLPKGMTFDYDDGTVRKAEGELASRGKIEITYHSYIINKGIADSLFKN
jgi:outer membrane lipoprotein-sorting protein